MLRKEFEDIPSVGEFESSSLDRVVDTLTLSGALNICCSAFGDSYVSISFSTLIPR
jgi:hypothetical protein